MGKEKKPKKGGMVIVIGVGAKPKKKDQMKKAEDDAPKRERRGRGGKRSTTRRFHDRVNTGRINLEEILDKRRIDPEEFHGEFRRRTGKDFDEYMSSGENKFDIQEMIDDIASKSAEARGGQREQRGQDRQRQIFDGLMMTPERTLRNMGIKQEDWKRAVTQRNREGGLTGDTFKQLTSKLGDRKKIAEMAEKRATISREKGQEAQAEFTEGGGYRGVSDEVFDHLTSHREDEEQKRHLATRGDEDDNEHEQNQEYERMKRLLSALNVQYSPDVVDAMARRYATEGRTGAPTTQAAVDHHGFATGGQGRGGGSSVSHLPSTVFTKPKAAANTRMSSPQEEEFEGVTFDPHSKDIQGGGSRQHQEFIMRALQSDLVNPMESAFSLLKANPDMTDSKGRTVPPAVMNYAQQARALEDSLQHNNYMDLPSTREDEREGLAAEDMREGENTRRFLEALKTGRGAPYGFRNKKVGGETMQEHHDFARDRSKRDTSEFMDYKHLLGEEDGNFGPDALIERQPRPEETDIANVMDDDIQRLNPKMKNFADASGKLQ